MHIKFDKKLPQKTRAAKLLNRLNLGYILILCAVIYRILLILYTAVTVYWFPMLWLGDSYAWLVGVGSWVLIAVGIILVADTTFRVTEGILTAMKEEEITEEAEKMPELPKEGINGPEEVHSIQWPEKSDI